jgi:hypothetical protein
MSNQPFNNDATPDERRDVVENDRKQQGGSYHSLAQGDLALGRVGRHAAITPTTVVGADEQTKYPGADQVDPVGTEPPLGVDLSAAPIVGEPHEIQASIDRLQKKPEDDGAM